MYTVQTFIGGFYAEFETLTEAVSYKDRIAKEFDFDPDYMTAQGIELYRISMYDNATITHLIQHWTRQNRSLSLFQLSIN